MYVLKTITGYTLQYYHTIKIINTIHTVQLLIKINQKCSLLLKSLTIIQCKMFENDVSYDNFYLLKGTHLGL